MSDRSSIEWTEATWNPVTGCSKVSPGCAHCYAETLSRRFGRTTKPWTRASTPSRTSSRTPTGLSSPCDGAGRG